MPPHSSHLLQPLDVGCFSPLKHYYGQCINDRTKDGLHVDKNMFLDAFKKARSLAMTEKNILGGYSGTGLYPPNRNRVLSKLRVQVSRSLTPPPTTVTKSPTLCQETPKTYYETQQHSQTISPYLNSLQESGSPLRKSWNFLKRSQDRVFTENAILRKENSDLRESINISKTKRERRKYIQKGGILSAEEGLALSQNIIIPRVDKNNETATSSGSKGKSSSQCSVCGSYLHTSRTCKYTVESADNGSGDAGTTVDLEAVII
jgi:hypothetical protein